MIDRQKVLEFLQELIRIPSINPHFSDGKCNETEIAIFICDWLTHRGISTRIEEVEPGRPNVFAEIGTGEGPTLCLCSHLDTVGVQEMTIPPFDPTVENNRVYGRGSCDMKGGLAAILSAAEALSHLNIEGKVILSLVCDEEYSSIGADDFVRRHTADACILTEPSDLQLVTAHKGYLWGKIATTGKSAHGSRWDVGVSAISKMGPILVKLDEFEKNVLRKRTEHLVGPASMHVSLIQGGGGISTYASTCEIHLERRTLPSETEVAVRKELEEVIYDACPDAAVNWYFSRPSFECDPKAAIGQCLQSSYQNVMGKEVEQVGWGVWTDAAIFQRAGIPTVNIGPLGAGIHEPVEWVDLDSVVQTAHILIQTTQQFIAKNKGDLCLL